MNPGAVVTNSETKEKFFILAAPLFPRVSIVNPALMRGVPRNYLVYSASDVIAHLLGVYFTAAVHPKLQSRLARNVFGVERGEQGIAALQAWYDKIGTPTRLPQLGIKESDLPTIVDNVQGNVRIFGIADVYTPEAVTAILKKAL